MSLLNFLNQLNLSFLTPNFLLTTIAGLFFLLIIFFLFYRRRLKKLAMAAQDQALVLDNLKDGLVMVDSSNRILYCNTQAAQILGLKVKEIVGRQAASENLKRGNWKNLAAVLALAETPTKENEEMKEGDILIEEPKQYILRVIITPTRDAAERLVGFMYIFHDVTEERILDQIKTSFITILSHSLRTPLAGIKWAVDMLLKEKLSPTDQSPIFEKIKEQNNLMQGMVENLIFASEIQKGKLSYRFAEVSLDILLKDLVEEVKNIAQEKGLTISLEKLPKMKIKADQFKLKIAFQNILGNALKYTKKGGKILVNLEDKKKEVIIQIADTGVGIPKEQQDKLFSKFFWAKNVIMHQHEGVGLGLFTTKEIIDKHQGKIWIESEVGKGTRVFVSFMKPDV